MSWIILFRRFKHKIVHRPFSRVSNLRKMANPHHRYLWPTQSTTVSKWTHQCNKHHLKTTRMMVAAQKRHRPASRRTTDWTILAAVQTMNENVVCHSHHRRRPNRKRCQSFVQQEHFSHKIATTTKAKRHRRRKCSHRRRQQYGASRKRAWTIRKNAALLVAMSQTIQHTCIVMIALRLVAWFCIPSIFSAIFKLDSRLFAGIRWWITPYVTHCDET